MTQTKNEIQKWIQLIHRVESQQFQTRIAGLTDDYRRVGKANHSPQASAFFGIMFSFMCTIYAKAYSYDTNFTSVLYGRLVREYFDTYYEALKTDKIHYENLKKLLQQLPKGFDNFTCHPTLTISPTNTLTYAKAVEFVKFVEDGGIEEIMRHIWREL